MTTGSIPTGKVLGDMGKRRLVLSRTFRAPIEDVWACLTESDRSARWIGSWTGEAAPGKTVQFLMTAEAGATPEPVTIRNCKPPHRLKCDFDSVYGGVWKINLELREEDGKTLLEFTHELTDTDDVASIGPGWEYYGDRLVAEMNDDPMPNWDDYYPAQSAFYESQKTP